MVRLNHGGIMANYECNAACRHCLYACAPSRSGGYIKEKEAKNVCALLLEGGCRSVHIGGGEPFLDFDGLIMLVDTATRAGISVEYIETNGFWAADENEAVRRLHALKRVGGDTLCISLDPFHAEYVSPQLPLRLSEICAHSGFGYFLWQERFLPMVAHLNKAHDRASLEKLIAPDYVIKTAQSYGLRYGGRAVNIEAEYAAHKPVDAIINAKPCRGLLSTNHFHVDLYERFIPPGCTGIAIPLAEVVRGIPNGKYPVFEALLTGGTAGLLAYANMHGYEKPPSCPSACALCFHIRHWLSENTPAAELDREHYSASLAEQ